MRAASGALAQRASLGTAAKVWDVLAEGSGQIDLTRQPADVGDTYVLCSDGLWDLVARGEIATIAAGDPGGGDAAPRSPSEAAAALIELALKRDAPDNVTVAVIRLVAHGPAPSRRSFWRRGA